MAAWVHTDVLDNGLNYIKNNCDKVLVIIAYTNGDSYASVTDTANVVAESAMSSTDFTLSGSSNRTVTAASKSDAAANNTGNPTRFAYIDTVNNKVLWVPEENSAQTVTAGNPVVIPSLTHTSSQPV